MAQSGLFPAYIRRYVPSFIRHGAWRLRHRTEQAIYLESETGTKFQMLPVAFGAGALVYYSLSREPLLPALLLALVVASAIAVKTYGRLSGNIMLVALFVLGGITAGKTRTDSLATQMIEKPIRSTIEGLVLNRELRPKNRVRYTIRVTRMSGRSSAMPQIIRASASQKYSAIAIGEGITGLVSLRAPSGPAYPGGYDFAFQAWFNGIGANGFFLGMPDAMKMQLDLPLTTRMGIHIARIRQNIAERIRETLPGEQGSLAAALIVGDRSGIGEETAEALRKSGLAHILAISGLHMALVTATIMFLIRGTLALVPGIALYYPIRKWAAGGALAGATIYLVISGGSIATQRAWIMIAIMLVAILLDRRALTMRNVGLAALAVLVWRPESIVSPGFQMSFAAVAALIAVYEAWGRYRLNKPYREPGNPFVAAISGGLKGLSGLAVTSLIAGIATGLFAAYHFHRVAPLGLVANLAAMPLVSVVVMPMALVAMVLMPFGLEGFALYFMGMAIEQVVAVANWVAVQGPSGNSGFLPVATLLSGSLALIVATQLKSWLRFWSLPLILLAAGFYSARQFPDIIISESGNSVAIRSSEGQLHLLNPRREKFITNIWKKAFAPGQKKPVANSESRWRCDDLGCTIVLEGGLLLAVPNRPEALPEDCQRADIVIARRKLDGNCNGPQLVLDNDVLKPRGSATIRLSQSSNGTMFDVAYARGRFKRPWTRHREQESGCC